MKYFSEFSNQIYSNKTKEYFREVISSYDNNNFRSATVMLYSLVICDILYKLQELKDMYNDKIAEQILNEINKSKNASDTKQKSQWERELIEQVKNKTEFLDDDVYCNIKHLYDHRNLSAHPALNKDYDLFTPNPETVASHIRNMVEGVFIKPPVYITKVIDTLVTDLQSKKEVFSNDYEGLKNYLDNKYFNRMSEKMFVSTFKAIWKFVYLLDNEECKENANINNKCLRAMLELKSIWLLKNIDHNDLYCNINVDEETATLMVALCCNIVDLYDCFTDNLKTILSSAWDNSEFKTYPLHWFKFKDFESYKAYLYEQTEENLDGSDLDEKLMDKCRKHFINNGRKYDYIDFCLLYFSKSGSFNSADYRFSKYVMPYISEMTKEHFELYVEYVCKNSQISNRRQARSDNSQVVKKLIPILGLKSEDFEDNYSFKLDADLFASPSKKSEDDEITIISNDDELPF